MEMIVSPTFGYRSNDIGVFIWIFGVTGAITDRSALIVCKRLTGVRNFDRDIRSLTELTRVNGLADMVDILPAADRLRRCFFLISVPMVFFGFDERRLDSVT